MKLNYMVIGLILVFILTGCKKDNNDNFSPNNFSTDIEYVKYGTSFGMCYGYCLSEITVTNSKIDYRTSSWQSQEFPEVSNTENIDSKNWTELIDKVNFESFLLLDSIIGCPDCADGGAEWIEIKSNRNKYKVVFEYKNEPEEVKEYIGYLRTYLNTFRID